MQIMHGSCCGLREIAELHTHRSPEDAMKDFYTKTQLGEKLYSWSNAIGGTDNRFRFAVFTQATARAGYGRKFAQFIRDHALGDVIETAGNHKNPNSGHVLKAWIWTVNHNAVTAWGQAHAGK